MFLEPEVSGKAQQGDQGSSGGMPPGGDSSGTEGGTAPEPEIPEAFGERQAPRQDHLRGGPGTGRIRVGDGPPLSGIPYRIILKRTERKRIFTVPKTNESGFSKRRATSPT